jgi:glucose-1-phosphate thymidylyltransferase
MTRPVRSHIQGVIIAGGRGSRLFPSTIAVSKQLVEVYDRPLIYYPLTTLMSVGIQSITIVTTPESRESVRRLLGDGRKFGLSLTYAVQVSPNGIADAIGCIRTAKSTERLVIVLGDNIFAGQGYVPHLKRAISVASSAHIFVSRVRNAREYGVVTIGLNDEVLSIEEKPVNPKSDWAVTGLYVYRPDCLDLVRTIKPSARDEIEITDLNRLYLDSGRLQIAGLGKGCRWFDVGNPDALLRAALHIRTVQKRRRFIVGSPEIAAFQTGFITSDQLRALISSYPDSYYRNKLVEFID